MRCLIGRESKSETKRNDTTTAIILFKKEEEHWVHLATTDIFVSALYICALRGRFIKSWHLVEKCTFADNQVQIKSQQ